MLKLIFRNDWLWKKSIKGNYYYPIVPYKFGIRADKNLNIYGGDPVSLIVGGALMVGGTMGAAAISSSAQKKAAANAADLAREQQTTALAEQQRLEEKYGLTPGELAREQRLFGIPEGEEAIRFAEDRLGLEPKVQSDIERRAGMSGEELLREVGPETRNLLDQIAARQGKTGEELFKEEGAIPTALQEQILAEVKAPEKFYEDVLGERLELARQMVNQEANRRGVFGGLPEGGIRFEQLGRAGVDLAIKSATEKMNARQQALSNASILASLFQNLSAGARGEAATVGERALSEKEKSRAELQDFLAMMEQATASAKGRAAGVATGTSQVAQQQTGQAYSALREIEGYKGTIQGPAEAGLSAIGQLGAGYLGYQLASGVKAPADGTAKVTLEDIRKTSSLYDPLEELQKLSGGYGLLPKKRQYALLE